MMTKLTMLHPLLAYDERGIALNDDNGNKQYDNRPWRFTKA